MPEAPGKAGEVSRMKEPDGEGVANHTGLKSWVAAQEGGGQALTEVRAGRVLSRENSKPLWGADLVGIWGRRCRVWRYGEAHSGPARSETPCTHGNTLRGTREIPRSASGGRPGVRTGNPEGASR
jgi:hypothetical protein